jgi:hypothetical protein
VPPSPRAHAAGELLEAHGPAARLATSCAGGSCEHAPRGGGQLRRRRQAAIRQGSSPRCCGDLDAPSAPAIGDELGLDGGVEVELVIALVVGGRHVDGFEEVGQLLGSRSAERRGGRAPRRASPQSRRAGCVAGRVLRCPGARARSLPGGWLAPRCSAWQRRRRDGGGRRAPQGAAPAPHAIRPPGLRVPDRRAS